MLEFAAYTRHSLARHGDYTTVAGEFAAIEAYLALARAVHGEKLRVQVRIAPEILPVAVPYLALQPLVENAVRHGVEATGREGLVQVAGEAQGSECVITVEDDGPGMDPDYAAEVLAGRGRPGHLGLVNVDRRLRAVFGPGYGLIVETRRTRAPTSCCGCPASSPEWWRADMKVLAVDDVGPALDELRRLPAPHPAWKRSDRADALAAVPAAAGDRVRRRLPRHRHARHGRHGAGRPVHAHGRAARDRVRHRAKTWSVCSHLYRQIILL